MIFGHLGLSLRFSKKDFFFLPSMAQVAEEREKGHNHMSNFQRDPLKRFMALNRHHHHHHLPLPLLKLENQPEHGDIVDGDDDEEEELELSLGLSMNGRFGVDPTAKKIKRTTSIPEFVKPVRDEGGYVMPMPCTSLIRTCSLPTETEEEWRKRKELQTLRRLEARRKRSEKQRNLKAMRERNRSVSDEVVGVEGNNNNNQVEQGVGGAALNEFTSLRRTTSLTSRVGGLGLNGGEKEKEKGSSGLPPPSPPQVSIGSSQGTGSSGISESESQQGTKPVDARSPISTNSLPNGEKKSQTPPWARFAAMTMRAESNKHSPPHYSTKDILKNMLEDMPCVSTKGEGPNGKKIEGFLYRYGKGEEVRIVCVCHGSFLTPAEFVKHAGGGDVANPLKHIVVSTPSVL